MNGFISHGLNGNAESPKIRGETVTPPMSFPICGIISPFVISSHTLVDLKIVESWEFPGYPQLAHVKRCFASTIPIIIME